MAGHVDDGVIRMELAVGVFEGLLDALDVLHDVQGANDVHIHAGGIPDQADDGLLLADGHMGVQPHGVEPIGQVLHLFGIRVVLEQDYHFSVLRFAKMLGMKKAPSSFTAWSPSKPFSSFPIEEPWISLWWMRPHFQRNPNKPYPQSW